ncbi:hypothetical protein KUCAC02_029426, partial [Chaenocephalus aceratus]
YTHQAGHKASFEVSPQSLCVEGLHVFNDTAVRDAPVESQVSWTVDLKSSPLQVSSLFDTTTDPPGIYRGLEPATCKMDTTDP